MADPWATVAKVSSRFRRHRVDSKLLILFFVATTAAGSLLWLASEVLEGDTFALDSQILLALRQPADLAVPSGPHWVLSLMQNITNLGSGVTLTMLVLFASGALVAARMPCMAIYVAVSTSIGTALSWLLKSAFMRPRPQIVPHLAEVSSSSFPSGHSMNSAIVYLSLAILLARAERRQAVQNYLLCSALVLVMLIGISRVYLGVHWPSDVLFGWSVGATWAALSSLIAKRLQTGQWIESPHNAYLNFVRFRAS